MHDVQPETRVEQLEQRLARLEAEVARLKAMVPPPAPGQLPPGPGVVNGRPWWEAISGTFANDPEFEEAMRLGREWRESFRPKPKAKPKRRKPKKQTVMVSKAGAPGRSGSAAQGKRGNVRARHGSH